MLILYNCCCHRSLSGPMDVLAQECLVYLVRSSACDGQESGCLLSGGLPSRLVYSSPFLRASLSHLLRFFSFSLTFTYACFSSFFTVRWFGRKGLLQGMALALDKSGKSDFRQCFHQVSVPLGTATSFFIMGPFY